MILQVSRFENLKMYKYELLLRKLYFCLNL